MAEMVRLNEDLLAIRLGLIVRDRAPVLVAELFRGWDPVGNPAHVPLSFLGVRKDGTDGPLFDLSVDPPDRLWTLFKAAGDHAEDSELLWLQIADGAEILAAYPWEAAFSEVAGRTIVRVPNFIRDPFLPDDPRPFAICAASPDPGDWAALRDRTEGVLSTLTGTRVRQAHLFVGPNADWAEDLERSFPSLQVRLDRAPFLPETRSVTESPWLAQMVRALGPTCARAVHFVCPCVASELNGAIALPETARPSGSATLVGTRELAAFLDRLDCPLAGFSPLVRDDSDEGARLLVNALSWLRPGPIVAEFGGADALRPVYAALFDHPDLWAQPNPETVISAHPKLVAAYEGSVRTVSAVARRELSLAEPSRQGAPGLDLGERAPGFSLSDEPRWLTRKLDQLSSARPRSPTQTARDRGARNALDFVSRLTAERDR
ncbi:hypothetical protein EYC08_16690 [Tabrizicola sp. WMC-M-20]|nr:hypothetical protein EYC08_16690 [Tabrizicola sp. WMC-M-20]